MTGRLVVITGGGSGMGKATALAFVRCQDEVVILGRRVNVLRDAARELQLQTSKPVRWQSCDVSDPGQVQGFLDWLVSEGIKQPIDVLVNNAGGATRDLPEETLEDTAALCEADFRSNVLTAVLITTGLESRLRRPGGRIVTIAS